MDWSTIGWISYIVLWIVVIVQCFLTLSLARLVGQLSRRFPPSGAMTTDPGPELGEVLADWEGTRLDGQRVHFTFPRSRGLFFFYVAPSCSVCDALLPAGKSFFREISKVADTVLVMVHGSQQLQQAYVRKHGLENYRLIQEEDLPESWTVGGAPFGVWLDRNGEVRAKGLLDRREHLESLYHAAASGIPTIQALESADVGEFPHDQD